MKDFMAGLLVGLIVLILFGGIYALGCWCVTLLLNMALNQIGLGALNMWGTTYLVSGLLLIYKYIKI